MPNLYFAFVSSNGLYSPYVKYSEYDKRSIMGIGEMNNGRFKYVPISRFLDIIKGELL